MRTSIARRAFGTASALLLLPALFAGSTATTASAAPPAAATAAFSGCGSTAATVKKTLPNGTAWTMCWRISGTKGLVLEQIAYQPKREAKPLSVLTSAALAQVNVPYDSGETEYNDLSDFGFGNHAVDIGKEECPGGTISSAYIANQERTVKAMCAMVQPHGYAYRSQVYNEETGTEKKYTKQGDDLVVFSVTKVGWYEYVTQWSFSDDGTISAKVGATGDLSPSDYSGAGTGWPIGKNNTDRATNHYHSVLWRLNFHLDDSSQAKVEQFDTKKTGTSGTQSAILKTVKTPVTKELMGDKALRRWWRVVSTNGKNSDNHARSWELVQQKTDKYDAHAYTSHDVYFTQYKACEQLASVNTDPACAGRGTSVNKWVNGQTLKHPITWVNVGFHHIPRDEDQSPMPIHWQGFQLVPRDVTAMSPITPEELEGANGHHE